MDRAARPSAVAHHPASPAPGGVNVRTASAMQTARTISRRPKRSTIRPQAAPDRIISQLPPLITEAAASAPIACAAADAVAAFLAAAALLLRWSWMTPGQSF